MKISASFDFNFIYDSLNSGILPYQISLSEEEKNLFFQTLKKKKDIPNFWRILGECYYYGIGVSKDYGKSFKAFHRAFSKKEFLSEYFYGLSYVEGHGVLQNISLGHQLIKDAAYAGYIEAEIDMLMDFDSFFLNDISIDFSNFYRLISCIVDNISKKDPSFELSLTSSKYLRKDILCLFHYLIEKHYYKVEFILGYFYYYGYILPKNRKEGITYFLEASKHNIADADIMLGIIFSDKKKDDKTAFSYFKKAAEKDKSFACLELYFLYRFGCGVKKNKKKAYDYLLKATFFGDIRAIYHLGECFEEGYVVKKDLAMAIKCYRLTAKKGWPLAQYRLGILYEYGFYVEENSTIAHRYFLMAAKKGEVHSMFYLGIQYFYGGGTKTNIKKAFYWLEKAANLDESNSQCFLGDIYEKGIGDVSPNEVLALEWYKKAAKNEHSKAQYKLGMYYEEGKGNLRKNRIKALYWY